MRAARMLAAAAAVVALLLPAAGPAARAGAARDWQPEGPSGQDVLAVAARAGRRSYLLAATRAAGLFASADAGSTWRATGSGLPATAPVDWLSFAGNASTILALAGGLPYRSDDLGAHWRLIAAGLPAAAGLTTGWVAPGNPATVFLGGASGLYRSTDGGGSWQHAASGLQAADRITFVTGAPGDPRRLLIGASYHFSHGGRVYRSTDGGDTWREADRGLPPNTVPWQGTWSTARPDTAWVGAGTVFRTDDGGRHWHRDGAGLPAYPYIQALVRLPDDSLLAAYPGVIARRGPGDNAWSVLPGPWTATALTHALVAAPDGRVLAATADGLFAGGAGGSAWRDLGLGMPSRSYIYSLLVSPDDGRLYAGGDNGVWRYAAPGQWEATGPGLPVGATVGGLLAVPGPPPRLYCATNYGVYASLPLVDAWRMVPGPTAGRAISALAYAQTGDTIYAAPAGGGIYAAPASTLHWRLLPGSARPGPVRTLLADRLGRWLLAGGAWSGDGGRTWQQGPRDVLAALQLRDRPQVLLAGTAAHGMVRSADGGRHWRGVTAGVGADANIPALTESAAGLYAIAGGMLIGSEDAGLSWRPIGAGTPGPEFTSLQALPGAGTRLMAGTAGMGVLSFAGLLPVPAVALSAPTATASATATASVGRPTASPTATASATASPTTTASPTATASRPTRTPAPATDTPVPPVPVATGTPGGGQAGVPALQRRIRYSTGGPTA